LAGVLARVGAKSRAETVVRKIGESPHPVFGRVLYHVLSGDLETSADWYERAIEERDPFALVFAYAPLTSDLRESPRWPQLARMMNLLSQPPI